MQTLIDEARAWIAADPDPETRQELIELIENGEEAELAERFSGPLEFGTAGIRGAVGAGPSRMNRAVVIRTTAGLAEFLKQENRSGPVVVGFDARPSSRTFAEDAVGVLLTAGFDVKYFSETVPTPVVAFACKELDASAAVVVTASHNPPADNGYKVYDSNGAQIIPPTDTEIAALISASGPADEVPRIQGAFSNEDAGEDIDAWMVKRYMEGVAHLRPNPQASAASIVYTPIHGVGTRVVAPLFESCGYPNLTVVPEQGAPDGTFPTVAFPNPEEPGALDLAFATAAMSNAQLVLANDPDSDRLAVALPDGDTFAPLSGNEIGMLLGDYVLQNWAQSATPIVINSIVSSPALARIAAAKGARHTTTLTGFKWISNAAFAMEASGDGVFAFGYEEALGYTVGRLVSDKDGISAALVFADLFAQLAEDGRTVVDRLEELWTRYGMWASSQVSIAMRGAEGQKRMRATVADLAMDPPSSLGGEAISKVTDYRSGEDERPAWLGKQDLIQLDLSDGGRLLVRPSGTEPKLKIYIDLVSSDGPMVRREQVLLTERAQHLGELLASELGLVD